MRHTTTTRPNVALLLDYLSNAYQRDLDRGPLRDATYVYGPRFPRTFGLSARVETLVAIELAVSWNPFVKSKKSATATTATSVSSFTRS